MSVVIQNLQSGTIFRTRFTDDFNRADTTIGLGTDWVVLTKMNGGNSATGRWHINSNRCRADRNDGIAGDQFCWTTALYVHGGILHNRSQFAQGTVTADNGAAANRTIAGVAVMVNGFGHFATQGNWSLYWAHPLFFDAPTGRLEIVRASQADTGGTSQGITAGGVVAIGDTIRLTAQLQSGQVLLTAFVNGVQVLQATDATGSQVRTGIPGMFLYVDSQTANGKFQDWDDWICGAA